MVDARNDDRLMMIALQNNVDDWFSFLKIMIQKKKDAKACTSKAFSFSLCEKECHETRSFAVRTHFPRKNCTLHFKFSHFLPGSR